MIPAPVPVPTDPAELQRYAADMQRVIDDLLAELRAVQKRLTDAGL